LPSVARGAESLAASFSCAFGMGWSSSAKELTSSDGVGLGAASAAAAPTTARAAAPAGKASFSDMLSSPKIQTGGYSNRRGGHEERTPSAQTCSTAKGRMLKKKTCAPLGRRAGSWMRGEEQDLNQSTSRARSRAYSSSVIVLDSLSFSSLASSSATLKPTKRRISSRACLASCWRRSAMPRPWKIR
jgi:hypothetical protein